MLESRPYDPRQTMRLVVSRKTGLVGRLQVLARRPGEFAACQVHAGMARLSVLPMGGDILDNAGVQLSVPDAANCGLHEAIERYCAAFADMQQLIRLRPAATASPGAFLVGDRFPLFAESQYDRAGWPWRRLTVESEIYWAEARSLHTGRLHFAPAILVYVPYVLRTPDEVLAPSTSSGMACAWSWSQACLTGLFEVCERDAFMMTWLHRLSMPRLRVEPGSPLARDLGALCDRQDARVTFVNLTNDFRIPTVLAVLESRWRGHRTINVGTAARPSLESAARKALLEAVADYSRLAEVRSAPGHAWQPTPGFTNVTDFEWHSLVYADPALQEQLAFLTASPVEQPMPQPVELEAFSADELLAAALARIESCGQEAFAVALTTRDIAELGLHVVKVIVPGAVQMNPDHRFPLLGAPRLYRVPRRMGLLASDATLDSLNLAFPHPFA